ncbi:MAG: cyclase, partial [Acidobacteriota bacterium]|nr:cyclase [Acidobacteriota bacterium]
KVGQVTDAVLKELSALCAAPLKIKYLINTHYHFDHTGNNEALGKHAETIIMHPNCIASLIKSLNEKATENTFISKIQTWTQDMVINLGGETVRLLHFGSGHTAGDLVVVFEKAKVLQTGDLFFNGMPAYIDIKDGADTGNWVKTIETLCKQYPDYKIIPGHGEVTTAKDWLAFADYLKYLRKETAAAIKAGKTKEQAVESINTDQFKQIKANERGKFMTIKTNIGWIYDEMTRKK